MKAAEVFHQQNGEVTKAYYAELGKKGFRGMLAVALFRAQKRSTAAKRYRGRKYTAAAYDVKNWSMGEICRVLSAWPGAPRWGWARDHNTPGYTHVLYVDLPTGQCSFHCAERLTGPDYPGKWESGAGSESNILEFCEMAWDEDYIPKPETARRQAQKEATV